MSLNERVETKKKWKSTPPKKINFNENKIKTKSLNRIPQKVTFHTIDLKYM
jgi:hypothetical protein